MDAPVPPPLPSTAPAARPPRLGRRLLLVFLLLVVALLLAPFYVDPLLRGVIAGRLGAALGATVTLRKADFSWPGRLRLTQLEVSAEDGPLAAVQDVSLALELPALLRGRLRATVEVLYPELHVRRMTDGRWNWERVVERLEAASESSGDASETHGAAPDVHLSLGLQEGRVVLHGTREDTRIEGLSAMLEIQGLERPAPFELAWRLRGPGGPGGSGKLSGSLTAAPEGRLDALEATGEARLELQDVELAALAPALDLVLPLQGAGGRASGSIQVQLGRGLALVGTSALVLSDARLQGPIAGAPPTRLRRLALEGRADLAGDGAGTQHLELRADELLTLIYDGHTRTDDSDQATLEGTVTLDGRLEPLVEATRSWIPFQPGVQVRGEWNQSLEIAAELRSRRPLSVSLATQGGLTGLAARDAGGRELDLTALARVALDLEARADLEADTLHLASSRLELGPVEMRADGVAQAFSTHPVVQGHASLQADLERLRGTLEQLVELPAGAFGGRIEASASAEGNAAALRVEGRMAGRDLRLADLSLGTLEATLQGDWKPLGDSQASGDLRLEGLRVMRAEQGTLEWSGLSLGGRLARRADGEVTLAAHLDSDDHALDATCTGQGQLSAALDGQLVLRPTWTGRLDLLGERLRALAPELAPLAGRLEGGGELTLDLQEGRPARLAAGQETRLTELGTLDPDGQLHSLPGLSEATLELRAVLDPQAGDLELEHLALRSRTLQASGRAHLRAAPAGRAGTAEGALRFEEASFGLQSDLGALGAVLATLVDLDGSRLGGGPLRAEGVLEARGTALELRGRATAASLTLERADAPALEQNDLHAAFDLELDPARGSLVARELDFGSRTASATLRGRIVGFDRPQQAQGELHLTVEGELERLLVDLGLEPPGAGRHTIGRLRSRLALAGTQGAFRLEGSSFVEGFRLEVAAEDPGQAPLVIEEPRIELALEADLALETLDVEFRRLTLASGLVRGGAAGGLAGVREWLDGQGTGELRFHDWTGELVYVPDLLGAVLAPWLPGRLTGSEERRATLVFEGRARDLDLGALLAGARGHVDLGLGKLVRPELELEGDLGLDLQDGRARVRGDLAANGGTLSLNGDLALDGAQAASPASTLGLEVRELKVNSGLAPLLALVHPAFGAMDLTRGELGGLLALSLQLTYDGRLPVGTLAEDWRQLSTEPLHGSGRLEIRGASLRGSPLLQGLADLGLNAERALDVRPIEFTIEHGRLSYARPWTWTLSGAETTFTGSVGLDQSLDLTWNVPVTETLVKRWGFLQSLLGERIAIPLRGTVTRPRLETSAALELLGKELARKELGSRLGLGGGSADPAQLLAEADRLWEQGKKAEAARLYARLRDEFKLSLVYVLNKDRIKDRSKTP